MPFQMPITVAEVLRRIQTQEYVLPAIQREFVWSTDQIARLFDSLMREYPIGSFLFWKIDGAHTQDYAYYGVIRDYHQKDAPHCPVLDVPHGRPVTAILDGQQRLTALNIGLRGSHASKLPGKWVANPDAYPRKRLYLNICGDAQENELGIRYDFRFFDTPPVSAPGQGEHWFPVNRILGEDLDDASNIFEYVLSNGLNLDKRPFQTLTRLHKAVCDTSVINFYEEPAPDLDKVLDIFIRVNSGGTVLSHSDLLLSIATAQWTTRDARTEIHQFVDELNRVGQGFVFGKDVVLKAGLVLTEVSDVGFKVSNFNRANMLKLEQEWDSVASSLRLAAGLLADFGFSGSTLPAASVLIPVAYYLHRRGVGEAYRISSHFREDRQRVRHWMIRTILKPGVWGSGLDTLLDRLRTVLAEEGGNDFPVNAVEAVMAQRGKALRFTPEEIDDLVVTPYGDRRAFPLLALLFPHVNTRNLFHVDHVFPRALFRRGTVEKAGLEPSRLEEWVEMVNALPNLQLLEGTLNLEKQDQLPSEWLAYSHPETASRKQYEHLHALTALPDKLGGFPVFFDLRRQRLRETLVSLLGQAGGPEGPVFRSAAEEVGGVPGLPTPGAPAGRRTSSSVRSDANGKLRIQAKAPRRRPDPYRLDAVCRAADDLGFGPEFRALCNAAEQVGLYAHPWTKCVMFTPPQNRSVCAVTVWCRREDHGDLGVWVSDKTLNEYFGIAEEAIVEACGWVGWRELRPSDVPQVVQGLKKLFGSHAPRESLARLDENSRG